MFYEVYYEDWTNQVKHSRHLSLLYLKKKYPERSPLLKIHIISFRKWHWLWKGGSIFFFLKKARAKQKDSKKLKQDKSFTSRKVLPTQEVSENRKGCTDLFQSANC